MYYVKRLSNMEDRALHRDMELAIDEANMRAHALEDDFVVVDDNGVVHAICYHHKNIPTLELDEGSSHKSRVKRIVEAELFIATALLAAAFLYIYLRG